MSLSINETLSHFWKGLWKWSLLWSECLSIGLFRLMYSVSMSKRTMSPSRSASKFLITWSVIVEEEVWYWYVYCSLIRGRVCFFRTLSSVKVCIIQSHSNSMNNHDCINFLFAVEAKLNPIKSIQCLYLFYLGMGKFRCLPLSSNFVFLMSFQLLFISKCLLAWNLNHLFSARISNFLYPLRSNMVILAVSLIR